MNIGEFAASHGKKLILGDLTSLSDRSLCPGEPSSFRDLSSDDEPVEFHFFSCFQFSLMVHCRVSHIIGNTICEHQFSLICISLFVVTWHFPWTCKAQQNYPAFWSWSARHLVALSVGRCIKWHGFTSNACYSIRSPTCVSEFLGLFNYCHRVLEKSLIRVIKTAK